MLADSAYAHLCSGAKCPVIVADDAKPADDPYEALLREGRKAGKGMGFANIVLPADEEMFARLCCASADSPGPTRSATRRVRQ